MSRPDDPQFEELNVHVTTLTEDAAATLKLSGFDASLDGSSEAIVISALLVTPYQAAGVVTASGAAKTYEKRAFGVRFVLKASKAALETTVDLGGLAAHGTAKRGDVTARIQGLGLTDDLQLVADKAIGDFTGTEFLALRKFFNEYLPAYIESKERQGLMLDTYSVPGPGSTSPVPHKTIHFAIRMLAEGASPETALQRFHPSADESDATQEILREVYLRYGAKESGDPPDDAIARAKSWLRAVQLDD